MVSYVNDNIGFWCDSWVYNVMYYSPATGNISSIDFNGKVPDVISENFYEAVPNTSVFIGEFNKIEGWDCNYLFSIDVDENSRYYDYADNGEKEYLSDKEVETKKQEMTTLVPDAVVLKATYQITTENLDKYLPIDEEVIKDSLGENSDNEPVNPATPSNPTKPSELVPGPATGYDMMKDIASAKEGDTIEITADQMSESFISKKALELAKEKGVKLKIDLAGNPVKWTFERITSDNLVDFIPTAEIGAKVEKLDKLLSTYKLSNGAKYSTLSFDFDGQLPGKAEVTVDLTSMKLAKGTTVYLYYFNEKENKFEYQQSAVCDGENAVFTFTHCSDYLITTEKLPVATTTPKTGDNNATMLFGALLVAGSLFVVVSRRKRV